MILWLDADTYTFANIPESFIRSTLPENKMTCYLGRGGMYPECGWVGYNKKHAKLNEFINTWTSLYKDNTIFDELEWHDSYLYWQVLHRLSLLVRNILLLIFGLSSHSLYVGFLVSIFCFSRCKSLHTRHFYHYFSVFAEQVKSYV